MKYFWVTLVFLLGAYIGIKTVKQAVPERLYIVEGDREGFIRLQIQESQFINVMDGESPGSYLAFPIYAEVSEDGMVVR